MGLDRVARQPLALRGQDQDVGGTVVAVDLRLGQVAGEARVAGEAGALQRGAAGREVSVVLAAAAIIWSLILLVGGGGNIFNVLITVVIYGAVLYYLNQPTIKSLFGRA